MPNRLYYGDNLDVPRREIPSESVDLVTLDPPFNRQATYNVLFRSSTRSPTIAACGRTGCSDRLRRPPPFSPRDGRAQPGHPGWQHSDLNAWMAGTRRAMADERIGANRLGRDLRGLPS